MFKETCGSFKNKHIIVITNALTQLHHLKGGIRHFCLNVVFIHKVHFRENLIETIEIRKYLILKRCYNHLLRNEFKFNRGGKKNFNLI